MPFEDEGRDEVIHSQAKVSQKLPENHKELGESPEELLTHSSQKITSDNPANTLISDVYSPKLEDNTFLFKSPSWWYFDTAALEN